MDQLPADTLELILSYLELYDIIASVSLISKSFYSFTTDPNRFYAIHVTPTIFEQQNISARATLGGNGISDEFLNVISKRYPKLESLTISRENRQLPNYYSDQSYQLPRKSDPLFSKYSMYLDSWSDKDMALDIGSELSYKGLLAITIRCTNLVRLSIHNCVLTNQHLDAIAALNPETLKELVIDCCRIDTWSDSIIQIVREDDMIATTRTTDFSFPNLEVFIYKTDKELTNVNLPNVKYLELGKATLISAPNVEYLTLYNRMNIQVDMFKNVIVLRIIDMHIFSIHDVEFDAQMLKTILSSPVLEHLELIGMTPWLRFKQNMFSLDIANTTYANKLSTLKLVCEGLDDQCLDRIGTLFPKLVCFSLSCNSVVTSHGVAHLLRKCVILSELDIASCSDVSDSVFSYIAKSTVTDLRVSILKKTEWNLLSLTNSRIKNLTLAGTNAMITTDTLEKLRKSGIDVTAPLVKPKRIRLNSVSDLYNSLYNKNDKMSCIICKQLVKIGEYDNHLLVHEEVPITRTNGVSCQCDLPNCMFMQWGSDPNETRTREVRVLEHMLTNCAAYQTKCPNCLEFFNRKDIEGHMGTEECITAVKPLVPTVVPKTSSKESKEIFLNIIYN
jgi:hypothetical protein